MNHNAIIFAAGEIVAAGIGADIGYFAGSKKWKKKLEEEAAALDRTYKALAKQQEPDGDDDGKGSDSDSDEEPAEEEPEEQEEAPGFFADPLPVDEEYSEVIRDYEDTPPIYNISEYEYEDDNNYDKMEVVFFDEDEPHCIKSDTGEDLVDWPQLLGFDEGCLCDEMFDSLQECYVRNKPACIDFRVHRSSLAYLG